MPTSVAYIGTGQIMGWGNKAIEVSFYCLNLYFNLSEFISDSFCGNWSFGWRFYAQESPTLEVLV